MIDLTLISIFIPTFFLVSATPGMCMTLALSLGMSVGVRRTMAMMWGELIGVGLVAVLAVIGVASVMLNYPTAFNLFKWAGGLFLGYLGVQMWRKQDSINVHAEQPQLTAVSPYKLASQGFITAIANPKGWAFTMALLPPFINPDLPMPPQLALLVLIMLMCEFVCLMLYASGGRWLRQLLKDSSNVKWVNRIAGSLMIAVGIWLALSG